MSNDPLSNTGLPSDVIAEQSVLGAIILNDAVLEQATALLETPDFSLHSHRRIFDAMMSLKARGYPIDLVILHSLLTERKELEQVGGSIYIASLIDGLPQTDDIKYYCRIVKYKARAREAIALLNDGVTRLLDGEEELEAVLHRLQSKLQVLADAGNEAHALTGVYPTLNDFFSATLEEPEQSLFGVHRGEVAGLLAVTNYGKSTLLLNVALSVAAGQVCSPLAPPVSKPLRIVYVDCESPAARLRADVLTMLGSIADVHTAKSNFFVWVDAAVNDVPLNLSRPEHLKHLIKLAKAFGADLVIIDTAASAFELQDENSNAEVTRRVMKPLKQLAREVNCAVIFSHHIGKSNETQTGEGAYRGRGASAFGALARTVFTLERDTKKGPEYVVLSCPKIKGPSFEPTLMKLNQETRWFELCDEKPEARPQPLTAQEIANFVAERSEARTDNIKKHFAGRGAARTIDERIKEAARLSLIEKPNQQAPWRVCNRKKDHFEAAPQTAEESTISEGSQVCNLYKELQTANSKPNGDSPASLVQCSCGAKGLPHTLCEGCGEYLR